jgi:hypothetical protein
MLGSYPHRFRLAIFPLAPILWALTCQGMLPARTQAADAIKPIEGVWQGTLQVGSMELRLLFRLATDDDGKLTASMDSPDQGAKGIPVDDATLDGDAVTIKVDRIRGMFEGKLSAGGREIKGNWKQPGAKLPLDLTRLEKEPADSSRPQEPKKPYPYDEEEVTYQGGAEGKIKLAATLTLPKSNKPSSAVVLITGSGPQDRNETVAGHKPFLVLADFLTRHGIAVLRADDRGVGGSTGDTLTTTTDDACADVLAGVAYLKTRKEIDPRRIGLIGHSEGGITAPLAATRSSEVAFVVMLAGTGVTGEEIVYRQTELIASAAGTSPSEIADGLATNRQIFKIIKESTDAESIKAEVLDILAKTAETAGATADARQALADAEAALVLSPWFRFFLTHDPQPALRALRCPVLVLNGEKDMQVDPKQNLPPIEAALKKGGNTDYTITELAGLNHLFQHCQTGSPSEYSKIEETFSPEALELISNWIRARTK